MTPNLRPRQRLALVAWLCFCGLIHAGAWDFNSFGNDSALDWVENELKPEGMRAVEQTVARVAGSKGYLDVDAGSYAIAAAEVLAAVQGRPAANLPESITAIIKRLPKKVSETMRQNGRKALDRVLADDSELNDLWKENKDAYAAWRKSVEDIKARL